MITIQTTCPDHGDIKIEASDVLLGDFSYLVHCPEDDHVYGHLYENPIRDERIRELLLGAGVERLSP